MAIWALGLIGQPARVYVQATDPLFVTAQLLPGETLAPITEAQKSHLSGVRLLGDMQVELIEPGA